jgi:acetoin utilization protein AcuB
MLVRDIMTTNVVTVPSSTVVPEAVNIVRAHRIERLPVVDKGKLVGIVTKDTLLRAMPSQATTLSVHEMSYLLSKLQVKEIMKKEVVTIGPDETIEAAVGLAQSNRVGGTVVVEDGKVVGIITSNDLINRVLNPLLGLGEVGQHLKGQRIIVYKGGSGEHMQKVVGCINRLGLKMKSILTASSSEGVGNDLIIHLDTEDVSPVIAELKKLGLSSEVRQR